MTSSENACYVCEHGRPSEGDIFEGELIEQWNLCRWHARDTQIAIDRYGSVTLTHPLLGHGGPFAVLGSIKNDPDLPTRCAARLAEIAQMPITEEDVPSQLRHA